MKPPSCSGCGGPVLGPHAADCPMPRFDALRVQRLDELRLRTWAVHHYRRALRIGAAERSARLRGTTDFHALVWRTA